MGLANKILWEEGMQLYPHHFQQQDLYLESLIKHYFTYNNLYFWGIKNCNVDEDAIKLNKLIINHCSGILPDGTTFDTSCNAERIPILEIDPQFDTKFVYIGIKANQQITESSNKNSNYFITNKEVQDLANAQNGQIKDVKVCKLNLQILQQGQKDIQDYCYMPIIKLYKKHTNVYIDKNSYISPCIFIDQSDILLGFLETLVKNIDDYLKLKSITKKPDNDIENLCLRQMLNKYKYDLLYCTNPINTAPYELFKKFISFFSQIIIYAQADLEDLPIKYDHLNIYSSFRYVVKLINDVFLKLSEEKAIKIEFKLDLDINIFLANFALNNASQYDFIVQIDNAKLDECKLMANAIKENIKIAAKEKINKIILARISGVEIQVLDEKLPADLISEPNSFYFLIKQKGELWESIQANQNVAIYFPEKIFKINKMYLWITKK
jgi:type VI secretion system protein ImpJ